MLPPAIKKLFKKKPYLSWYIKNSDNLSIQSAFEHVLNYGQWEDFLLFEKEIGTSALCDIFMEISHKPRVNLRPQTLQYYQNYFRKYA